MVSLFADAEYPGFVLMVLWLSLVGLSVVWPLADNGFIGSGFAWDNLPVSFGRYQVDMSLYLPWIVSVCLVMWLGLEWAAVPAYLATLFSRLYKHMPLDIAVVDSLHNSLAMAVYFLFYCNYKGDYSLRSLPSWSWFILASLAAAMVSSIGAFISEFTGTDIGARDLMSAWLGWWPNSLGLSLVAAVPILLFTPAVERMKLRHFAPARAQPYSQRDLVLAASMFALLLVLFLLVDDQWAAQRTDAVLGMSLPQAVHKIIQTQFGAQRVAIWVLALLLAGVSLGGVFFTSRWVQRMRTRFDSEAREARAALRRSETNFRNFFDNNPAPMLLYDRDNGEFMDVNQAAIERYGYSRSEFLELTIFDIRPPEDVPKLKAYMREIERSSPEYRHAGEWRHLTKAGELMYVDVRVSAIVIDNRAMNLVLIYDVSHRKQAQVAVERRARELQALAASSLQIAGVRSVAEVLQVSAERARELSGACIAIARCETGELRASMSGAYEAWSAPEHLPDSEGVRWLLREKHHPIRIMARDMQEHPELWRFDPSFGRTPPMALLVVPLTRSDGDLVGALMVADKDGADFDAEDEAILLQLAQGASAGIESVQLHEALEQHMQELELRVTERTAELDAFAYSVAHDLRAPLRAMHGFADAVLEDYTDKLDDAGRDYLARIIKSAKNMDHLIQDLLAYSRIGRDKVELKAVSLAEVVQEALTDLQHDIESRGARVHVDVPPLTVLAYKATLKQVVLNLVSNALKFVAPGKVPEVNLWAVARKGMVELCVRDNGIGIAPEHRERIFNVFERLHAAETYPGTGIGLSIVKKGLASMQGGISIDSDDRGSTFHARLKEYRDG